MAKNQTRAMQFGFAAVLLWSTVATAFKLSLAHMSPAQLLLYASLTSATLLAAIVLVQKRGQQVVRQWRGQPLQYIKSGLLNPFLYYLALFGAYDRLPAQQAQALNYTWAILLSLLAVPMLGQKLRRWDVLAAVAAYFGVVVIATGGNLASLDFASPLGVGLALLSTLLWSLYWIVNTKDQGDPVASLLLSFLVSLPCIALVCAWRGELALPSWQGLAGAAYVGLFEMGLTFVLWLTAMRTAERTAPLSNLVFLGPFLSLFFIAQILGEAIAPATLYGLGLIVAGLLIQQFGPKWQQRNATN
ncbi:DMT family transporter [Ferrimonas marina]|uniref:EamA domain-containing membrane protein RarD n=1 Tax=Ferrimonas marina TaxID=299255 RepID=A0A1M5VCW5_9GAMM|nr:DMT family transporter [Ferrimonas marina]SHH73065.1 EamA domain-containing membrane protein RarD [Ferrimonas marina]